jgi:hypothetical protein
VQITLTNGQYKSARHVPWAFHHSKGREIVMKLSDEVISLETAAKFAIKYLYAYRDFLEEIPDTRLIRKSLSDWPPALIRYPVSRESPLTWGAVIVRFFSTSTVF